MVTPKRKLPQLFGGTIAEYVAVCASLLLFVEIDQAIIDLTQLLFTRLSQSCPASASFTLSGVRASVCASSLLDQPTLILRDSV